jgi:predicted nuclease of predicted toxin-antitoxin system
VRTALGVECTSVRDLALQRAADLEIFHAARNAGALVMTKDADFAALVHQFGAPPQIVLVTCGNTSNTHLRQVLGTAWPTVALMLERGEPLVEIGDRRASRSRGATRRTLERIGWAYRQRYIVPVATRTGTKYRSELRMPRAFVDYGSRKRRPRHRSAAPNSP